MKNSINKIVVLITLSLLTSALFAQEKNSEVLETLKTKKSEKINNKIVLAKPTKGKVVFRKNVKETKVIIRDHRTNTKENVKDRCINENNQVQDHRSKKMRTTRDHRSKEKITRRNHRTPRKGLKKIQDGTSNTLSLSRKNKKSDKKKSNFTFDPNKSGG